MEISYVNYLKKAVCTQISEELHLSKIDEVVHHFLARHLVEPKLVKFQQYYFQTIDDKEFYLNNNFFKQFKFQYSLQGIDNDFLNRLEESKPYLLDLITNDEIEKLYLDNFRKAELKRKEKVQYSDLASFFAKFVHTFNPHKYCALDNPIRNHFKLGKESFYLSFLIISSQYKKWCEENQPIVEVIKSELKSIDSKEIIDFERLTDLKLLDMIFWSKAN